MALRDREVRQLMAYVIFGHHMGWPELICRPDRVEGVHPLVARARGPLRIRLDQRSRIASDGITVPIGQVWKRKRLYVEGVLFVPWEAIVDVMHGDDMRTPAMPLPAARNVPKLEGPDRG